MDILVSTGALFENAFVVPLATMLGQPADECRLVVVFLFQYPLGWLIHYCIYGTIFRHWFVTIIGILIQLFVYGRGCYLMAFMAYGSYALMQILPNEKSLGRNITFFVFSILAY